MNNNIDNSDLNEKKSGGEQGNKFGDFKNKAMDFIKKAVEFIKKYWIYFSAGAAVVVLAIVILVARSCGGNDKADLAEETLGSVIAVESDETESATAVGNELQVDMYPQINNLIKEYFSARLACDSEALSKIVSDMSAVSVEKLQRESEYIEDYQNIKCYTKLGLLENTYIVYVYFEYKFYNIDTTAPAMIRMYVCTNEAGNVYICNESVDGEVASYMEEINGGEDITALFAETDDKLKKAIESDENLMGFYTKLLEGGGTTETTEEETTEAPTEAETEPESTEAPTEAETEAETTAENVLLDTDDTAFVKQDASVYSQPEADEQYKAGRVGYGERYRRIGYNDQWSLIELSDGTAVYVSNENLVIDKNFIYVNETVYAKQTVRVREETSYDSAVVGTLFEGESVQRIGYNDEWSKVIFEGDIYYIGKGFLTTSKPED